MSAQSRASRMKVLGKLGRNILQMVPALLRRILRGLNNLIARFAPGSHRATLPLLRELRSNGFAPIAAALRSHHRINSPPAGPAFFHERLATAPAA